MPQFACVALGTGAAKILQNLSITEKIQGLIYDAPQEGFEHPSIEWQPMGESAWGTGADFEEAQKLFRNSTQVFQKLKKVDCIIAIATLGGGIGSAGIAALKYYCVKERKAFLPIVFSPFESEGNSKLNNANRALRQLEDCALLHLDNEQLARQHGHDLQQAFSICNEEIAQSLNAMIEGLLTPGPIAINPAHFFALLKEKSSKVQLTHGVASGPDRINAAVNELFDSRGLISSRFCEEAQKALIHIHGNAYFSIKDHQDCVEAIKKLLHADCEIIAGFSQTADRQEELSISLLAVQTQNKPSPKSPAKSHDTVYNIQGELGLQELSAGIFENTPHKSELDIPTFLRQNIAIDTGK